MNTPDQVAGAVPAAPPDQLPPPELVAAAEQLTRERLAFAIPACLVTFGGFIVITLLAGFTDVLNVHVLGPITLLFVLLVAMFPIVGVFAYRYSRVAARWDARTDQLLRSAGDTA
jgi:uncharacterized membrane protein (DUF485 family)